MRNFLFSILALLISMPAARAESLRIPAATAYSSPDPDQPHIDEKGVHQWTGKEQKLLWFGEFHRTGTVQVQLECKLPTNKQSRLRLSIAGKSNDAMAKGNDDVATFSFGTFDIPQSGYQQIQLESLNDEPTTNEQSLNGDPVALILTGPALEDAHFNLQPRRNAASVHLAYPTPPDVDVEWFYCEVTALEDPVTTFYMACGFRRGYFGMQINSPTERRIIFSVWDAGNGATADDRKEVAGENQVTLIGKGESVHANAFGGEGTGGHSHLQFDWETGVAQRFLLHAEPEENQTVYTAYYYRPDWSKWMLIASMRAPRDGKYLQGLHSFSENFWGNTGHVQRKALFGRQWIQTADGRWIELTRASFSHDPTGKSDRRDRFMGIQQSQFFLSHGGFLSGHTKFGELFVRPESGEVPQIDLSKIPRIAER